MNLEHPLIKQALIETPELFIRKTTIENAEVLAPFGIYLPGKEFFPEGFIKLFPEDFIVEEIDAHHIVRTINYENVLGETSSIPGTGDTIYVTLVKGGLSTLEVIRELATKLRISEKNIGYAGIKDKYAITAQRISIRGAREEDIKKIQSPQYFFKDAIKDKGAISMANLEGNRFSIFIRTKPGASPLAVTGSEENFYNYFYLQRFGSPRFINFHWGYDILKGNYEKAVRSVLFDECSREIPYVGSLRQKARTLTDWKEVKAVFEPTLDIMQSEAPILEHLIKHPQDFKGALATIPEQIQLWLYGLASLLFNEKISYAVQREVSPLASLPFIFSNERSDIETYREELRSLGIYPPPFQNLRPFPFIRLAHRMTPTVLTASGIEIRHTTHGSVISFSLPKGAYATTFLSHHINIAADLVPDDFSKEKIDPRELTDKPERAKTIDLFKDIKTTE